MQLVWLGKILIVDSSCSDLKSKQTFFFLGGGGGTRQRMSSGKDRNIFLLASYGGLKASRLLPDRPAVSSSVVPAC